MITSQTQVISQVRGRFKKRIYRDANYLKAAFHLTGENPTVPNEVLASGEVVAKGCRLPESDAFEVILTGNWGINRSSKRLELSAYGFEVLYPKSKGGIMRVLTSGLYRGIGPKNAERIFDAFGLDAIEIVSSQPERLLEVDGIGKATMQAIIEGIQRNQELTQLTGLLAPFGISDRKIMKVYERFPKNSKSLIEENPYILCDLVGFTFTDVDHIARELGFPANYPPRLQAGVMEALKEANGDGDLYVPMQTLLEKTCQCLADKKSPQITIDEGFMEMQVRQMADRRQIVIETDFEGNLIVFSEADYRHEVETAKNLIRLRNQTKDFRLHFSDEELESEILRAQKELGAILSEEQKQAIKAILTQNVVIVLGKPGTGKTLIQRFVLWIHKRNVESRFNLDDQPGILLMTPTGRAAGRLSELARHPAYTIHRGLGIRPDEAEHSELPKHAVMTKKTRRIICDESSMLDMKLMASMMRKIPEGCQIAFIGDINQLESVGPGDVLAEMVKSGEFPVMHLNSIYRQGPNSLITVNAERIIAGNVKLDTSKESFMFLKTNTEQETADKLVDLYFRGIKKYGAKNVMIICPRRDEVTVSAHMLNKRIQKLLHERLPGMPECTVDGKQFYVGDRVMETDNNDIANNGDTGTITAIRKAKDRDCMVAEIHFDSMPDDKNAVYYPEELACLNLGFAMTIHKAEGSEFDLILMPVITSQYIWPKMLFTAITRAKNYIVLVGQEEAIRNSILRKKRNRRTMLASRINEEAENKE